MSGPCTDCGGPDYQTLEARIDELDVDLNALKKLYESRGEYIAELEAESASMADDICSLTTAHDHAEQAEAENERLRKRTIATEEDWQRRQNESRELLAKKEAHIEDCHRSAEQAEAELARLKSVLLHNRTSGGRPEMGTKP